MHACVCFRIVRDLRASRDIRNKKCQCITHAHTQERTQTRESMQCRFMSGEYYSPGKIYKHIHLVLSEAAPIYAAHRQSINKHVVEWRARARGSTQTIRAFRLPCTHKHIHTHKDRYSTMRCMPMAAGIPYFIHRFCTSAA